MSVKQNTATKYAIEFRFPEGEIMYAGKAGDSLGWAPTLETAILCDTAEEAGRWLANGYGASVNHGHIIEVPS